MPALSDYPVPFPAASPGQQRFVVHLPERDPEDEQYHLRVELLPGRFETIDDPAAFRLMGSLTENVVEGSDFNYYTIDAFGPLAHKIGSNAQPESETGASNFVPIVDSLIIPYSSRAPIVVYVPEDGQLRYKIWRDEVTRAADGIALSQVTSVRVPAAAAAVSAHSAPAVELQPRADSALVKSPLDSMIDSRNPSKSKKKRSKEQSESALYPSEAPAPEQPQRASPATGDTFGRSSATTSRSGRRRPSSVKDITADPSAYPTDQPAAHNSGVAPLSNMVSENRGLTAFEADDSQVLGDANALPRKLSAKEGSGIMSSMTSPTRGNEGGKPRTRRLSSTEVRESTNASPKHRGSLSTSVVSPRKQESMPPSSRRKSHNRSNSTGNGESNVEASHSAKDSKKKKKSSLSKHDNMEEL